MLAMRVTMCTQVIVHRDMIVKLARECSNSHVYIHEHLTPSNKTKRTTIKICSQSTGAACFRSIYQFSFFPFIMIFHLLICSQSNLPFCIIIIIIIIIIIMLYLITWSPCSIWISIIHLQWISWWWYDMMTWRYVALFIPQIHTYTHSYCLRKWHFDYSI